MTHRVVFRRAAKEELEAAAAWYDGQRRGLGEEFLTEVSQALNRVDEHPRQYPVVLEGIRRAVLRRFPYAIYFRERKDLLVVLAVFHGRRNPLVWRRRT